MKAARRPRGEKPATTIRYQQRQLHELQQIITGLRSVIADKEKVIAGYDVQLDEANEDCRRLRSLCADRSAQLSESNQKSRTQAERLAFLEGYYAKSQETAPARPIQATSPPLTDHQAETYARASEGNTPYPRYRPATSKADRQI